ncbi:YhcH/YjgK/YiaL family protein [Paenibacillus sp. FJAT-26967]|uniref:YhcH/YjgK/YiaL family protein n=1 Tax=Paenibacillus sp. FJAT-26967 TaxID=1729690 RepID=UPI000837C42E|nr:YhcH/YjgK/YiaL family protein [Paenibacillus sp. FJAT-26967]
MIIGHSCNWESERAFAHPVLKKALDYLLATDFTRLEAGQYPIQGEEMFARLMEPVTRHRDEQPAEKHEQFFDIHYLLEGEETIGWCIQQDDLTPAEPYNPEHDTALFGEMDGEMDIRVTPGMYVVLFPEDIHRPLLTEGSAAQVRKVVVKINKDLF